MLPNCKAMTDTLENPTLVKMVDLREKLKCYV